jgi:Holliday junction resolvase RusA-like endonuclease
VARVAFSIPGPPRGKDRPRGDPRLIWERGKPRAIVVFRTPKETTEAETEVLRCFRAAHPRHKPFTGPVLIKFVAVFPIPTSWPKRLREAAARGTLYAVKKPDKDNIEKLIVDALTPPKRKPGELVAPSPDGYAWVDDQQVMGGGIKRYGSPARVDVTIESLEAPDVPATPGQDRLEARVAAGSPPSAPAGRRINQTKADKRRFPEPLQRRIDAALARDAGRRK